MKIAGFDILQSARHNYNYWGILNCNQKGINSLIYQIISMLKVFMIEMKNFTLITE